MRVRLTRGAVQSGFERSLPASYWEQVKHKIGCHPDLSKPLNRGILKGLWTVKISGTRTVYRLVEDDLALIVAVGPRDTVYKHAEGQVDSE